MIGYTAFNHVIEQFSKLCLQDVHINIEYA